MCDASHVEECSQRFHRQAMYCTRIPPSHVPLPIRLYSSPFVLLILATHLHDHLRNNEGHLLPSVRGAERHGKQVYISTSPLRKNSYSDVKDELNQYRHSVESDTVRPEIVVLQKLRNILPVHTYCNSCKAKYLLLAESLKILHPSSLSRGSQDGARLPKVETRSNVVNSQRERH